MRLSNTRQSQVYISSQTKTMCFVIAEQRRKKEENVTADQVADEMLSEAIHAKYPEMREVLERIDKELEKIVARNGGK